MTSEHPAPRPWLATYPPGVPTDVDPDAYSSLAHLIDESLSRHADKPAYRFLGRTWTFAQVDADSRAFGAWLQSIGLKKGDRIALMMPNVPQYPVAVMGALRAGLIVVNVNPLYTARELEHQLKDSGASAIVILENFASTLQACIGRTGVRHVVLAAMGDRLGFLKGALVNLVVRRVRKLVPPFSLPGAVAFNTVLQQGRALKLAAPALTNQDIAVLQYTGGTTGVAKGAVLLHRNIVANMLQADAWNAPVTDTLPGDQQWTAVCALPLYHIFAFTVGMMLALRAGHQLVLIPNPRDLPGTIKELSQVRFHSFPAVNTLFNALANHPDFSRVDWSNLRISLGGGMAVQGAVAAKWLDATGCPICEGYGLSETAPCVSCNPVTSRAFTGTIGVPLPSTEMRCLDDAGAEVPVGEAGEIAIRGPQVMAGYWQRDDETRKVMTADGFFRTGDIGTMDAQGFFRIVDRKKDMILVSGFNVYPNEIEDVVAMMPGVVESAAVGVPDPVSGEAVRLVVVRRDESLATEAILAHCRKHLTGYKIPRSIEFRADLPKTPVGKILRRALRSESPPAG